MFARVSVPSVSVRVQRLAWDRLNLVVGATQLRPRRSPLTERVIFIRTFAATDSLKRNLVPTGARRAENRRALAPDAKAFVRECGPS